MAATDSAAAPVASLSEQDAVPELKPGTVIDGRYRIIDILGTGGVGVVYRADDLRLPHQVAIKLLRRQHVKHHMLRGRFEREARALAALSHPNIVSVSDYGIDDTDHRPFVVMELLKGQTLREALDKGPMDPQRAFEITKQLLRGLSYAHHRELIHRDIKPGNVFLQELDDQPELVKILDFGFAKFMTETAEANPNLSKEGIAMGTPSYLPPEQAAGAATDARADIYAVGVLLFEMLAGVKPFTGSLIELLRQHLTAKVPRISQVSRTRAETPELRKLIERAMAKDKKDRYADASQFLHAIEALPQPAIKKKGRVAMALAVTGLIAASVFAGAVAWVATRPNPQAEIDRLTESARSAWASTGSATGVSPPSRGPAAVETPAVVAEDPEPQPDASANEADAAPDAATAEVADAEDEAPVAVVMQVRELVDAEQPVPDDLVTILRTYARDNDSGPAYLLLAHVYSDRNWWSDAVRNYRSAFDAEPRIADDPVVLENLLHISAMSEAADVEAFDVVRRIYGRSALTTVETILDDPETSWQEKRQLRRLQRELRRLRER